MKPKIGLIALGVRDFAKSLAFYRDGLGLPTHNFKDGEDVVFFKMEGTYLALYPRDKLAEDAVIADGKADLIMLAHAMLDDPQWPYHAAKALNVDNAKWTLPAQYAHWIRG